MGGPCSDALGGARAGVVAGVTAVAAPSSIWTISCIIHTDVACKPSRPLNPYLHQPTCTHIVPNNAHAPSPNNPTGPSSSVDSGGYAFTSDHTETI